MTKINEDEIFKRFIGQKVNERKLLEIARKNGNGYGDFADSKEYIIAHVDYYDIKKFQEIFKLTSVLTDRWDYKGIDFRIYLYIRDEIFTGGHVYKYIDTTSSSHFRPTGYVTNVTQQELRIASRILSYLCSED